VRRIINTVKRFYSDQSGATLTEYILMVVLIAIVVLTAAALVGKNILPLYQIQQFLG
jgi:Flp pilus assembly pilin Flp